MPVVPQDPKNGGAKKSEGFDFDGWYERNMDDRKAAMRIALDTGRQVSPDQARRVAKLEAKTGLPTEWIASDIDRIEQEASRADFDVDAFKRNSPIVFENIRRHPYYTALGDDAIKGLAHFEQLLARSPEDWPMPEQYMDQLARKRAKNKARDEMLGPLRETLSPPEFRLFFTPEYYDVKPPEPLVGEDPLDTSEAAIGRRAEYAGKIALAEKRAAEKKVATKRLSEIEEGIYQAELSSIRDNEQFIAADAPIGFGEQFARRAKENEAFLLPFASGAVDAGNALELFDAASAVEDGTATDEQRDKVVQFVRLSRAAERRGKDVPGIVGSILADLPAYALEFSMTSGVYSAGRGLILKGGAETIKGWLKRVGMKALGAAAGTAARTAVGSAPRIVAGTARRMTSGVDINEELEPIITSKGDDFIPALLKSGGEQYIENLSELMGEPFGKGVGAATGWLAKKTQLVTGLKTAVAHRWLRMKGSTGTAGLLKATLEKGGWNGVLGEIFEERAAEVMKVGIGEEYRPPTSQQLLAEAIAFAFPAAPGYVGSAASAFRPVSKEKRLANPEFFLKVAQSVADLKIAEEAPEFAEPILADVGRRTGNSTVYAPVESWVEHYQGQKDEQGQPIDPRAKAIEILGSAEAYDEAVLMGGDIPIPFEKYALKIAPTDDNAFWAKELRQSPLEENEREAKETEKQVAAEAEKAKASPEDEESAAIGKTIEQGLRSAGRPARESRHAAAVSESIIRTLAKRYGYKPRELFSKAGIVSISGPKQQVSEALKAEAVQGEAVPPPVGAAPEAAAVEGQAIPIPESALAAKTFGQPGEGNPRGKTRIREGFVDIAMLKDADASTAIHEFGHLWLEILGKLVAEENAPEGLKKDYATILKWLGSENGVITEEQHEKFARGFETYLMEGKAPSAGLRAAFAKFRAWLHDLYKKLISLNAPLSDDVRAVFDRLMATEEEMAELENQHATGPLFEDIKALGFSEAEAARYSAAIESAKEARRTQLLVKFMESVREKKTAEYAKERKEVRAIVEREVNERRDYRAISILQTGKLPDGTEPDGGSIKLDRASTLETLQTMSPMFGEDALDQLPRGIFANLKEPQKVDMIAAPDVAADFLGYNSGGELLHAIMTAGDKEAAIDRLTDERMSAERPSIEDEPLAYYDEAVKALHAEGSAEAMREDALILASQQFATSKKLARRIAFSVPSIQSLNEMAEREIAKKVVSAIQPHLYQRAEKKAGRMAFDAFQKGDYAEAFRLKQLQLVNHALYKAAASAKDEVEAGRKRARRLDKESVRAKIGKAGQDYLDQIEKILERYDFRRTPPAQDRARKALAAWVREQQEAGYEPGIVDTLLNEDRRANYRDITMEEFRGVMEALESIEHLSNRDGQIRTVNGYLSKEVAVEELVKRAEASLTEKKEPAFPGMKRGILATLKDKLVKFDSEMTPMETLIELLDGGAVGPWHDYLWNRGADAEAGFHDLLAGVTEKVTALTEKYTKDNASRLSDAILTPLGSMTRQDLISIAFNIGNESNLDKMLRGHDWNEALVMAAVEKLTKRDLEYVQSVWDAIGALFPQLDDLNRRVQGLPLEKIKPRPLTLRSSDGFVMDMDGGYYPVFYDPRKSDVGKIQESGPLAGLMDEGYARATIPGSARKKRTGYAAPFLLDFTTILQKHLVGVVKDLTYREFLIDAQKILGDSRIRAVLQKRLGEHYEALFVGSKDSAGWLRSVANEHVSSPKLSAVGRLAEAARSRVVVVGLGFKAATVLSQFAGLSNSVEYIGSNYGVRYFIEAMAEFYRDLPRNLSADKDGSLRKFVESKSAAMRHRAETMDREIGDQMRKLKGDQLGSMTSAVSRASMFGIAFADRMIAIPTWLAAYRGALAKGATEDQAVHAGDAAVRRSQGSGSAKDLPAMLRERGTTRLFTMFMTPFSAVYGRLRAIREGGRKGWTAKYTAEAVIRAALVTLIPAILADILAGRGPGDDDKKRKKYGQWIAFKALNGVATTIPILREVTGAWENWAEGKPGDVRWSPVFSAIERVGSTASRARKATVGEDRYGNDIPWTDELGWDVFESSGYVFGLPTGQAAITGEYLTDLLTGEAKAEGVGSFLHDLLYRRSAKERK